MKCCFCGATLKEGYNDIVMSCFDTEPCPCYDGFKSQVYKALIDGKKAQDALKIAMEAIDILYDAIRHNNAKETCHIADYVLKFASEQRQILKEITSITKQENK